MKMNGRTQSRRVLALGAAHGHAPVGAFPGGMGNRSRDLTLRRDSLVWRARGGEDALWRSTVEAPHWGGWWGANGAASPRASLATRGRGRRLTAVHICGAPDCTRQALKPCFDCGTWRCQEHLLAAVHHRKSAIVHLCPTCLHAHTNDPDRLRLEGYEDARAERAADPLAPREGRRDEITALTNNRLFSERPAAQTERLWRLDDTLTPRAAKRTSRRLALLEE